MSGVPHIFDRKALALHRARSARMGDSFLAVEAAAGVVERVGAANRKFVRALDVGSSPEARGVLRPIATDWATAKFGDNETLDLSTAHYDLATSILALHAVNDLPGALVQIRRALKPDGLFVAAMFGGETLRELREAFAAGEEDISSGVSPRVAPFADIRDLGGLLQRARFNLPVTDSERTVVRYREFDTLVKDLRAAGETNAQAARSRKFLRRDVLAASLAHYAARHAEPDGRLRATFDIIYLTGWAPHEGQQKPLKPGSAKARLADALRTKEKSANDTTPIRRS